MAALATISERIGPTINGRILGKEAYQEGRSSVTGDGHTTVTPAEHNSETPAGRDLEEAGAHLVKQGVRPTVVQVLGRFKGMPGR